jgi:hypothetical protein
MRLFSAHPCFLSRLDKIDDYRSGGIADKQFYRFQKRAFPGIVLSDDQVDATETSNFDMSEQTKVADTYGVEHSGRWNINTVFNCERDICLKRLPIESGGTLQCLLFPSNRTSHRSWDATTTR